jgi:hypothetical protein
VLGSPFAIETVEELPATIILEGQEEGDHHHNKMGVYELVEGKEVNGRGVWQMAGMEYFMYYSSGKAWWIGNREWMEAGKAHGWLNVASTARTPDKVTGVWEVFDAAWLDAPKVTAKVTAGWAKRICVEGLEQGDHQHDKMGVYELMEGKGVNGRGVWQMAGGGGDVFLYNNGSGHWLIGDREDMEAGKNRAWLACRSSAITPSALTHRWKMVPEEAKGICTEQAPEVKSRCV